MSLFKWFRKSNKSDLAKLGSNDPTVQRVLQGAMEQTAENLNKGEHYYQQGLQAAQLKDFDGAIAHFNKSLEFADYISMVYLNRGAMYQMQERFLDAREDYMKMMVKLPEIKKKVGYVIGNLMELQNWVWLSLPLLKFLLILKLMILNKKTLSMLMHFSM